MEFSQLFTASLFILIVAVALWRLVSKQKKKPVADFPVAWRPILAEKVAFCQKLTATEKKRFEESIMLFLSEVRITGVQTKVSDTDRLLVASSAVIPLFGFPGWHYRNINEVLLYKGAFNQDYDTQKGEERDILGMVGGGSMNRTMILSKPSLHQGFALHHSKQNVGIHEFVHLLDRADGATDGIPEALLQQPFLIPWARLMHREIKAIKSGTSEINFYGSTSEAEFFSVVSEYFFQQPQLLEKHHPQLFSLLEKVFRQDG